MKSFTFYSDCDFEALLENASNGDYEALVQFDLYTMVWELSEEQLQRLAFWVGVRSWETSALIFLKAKQCLMEERYQKALLLFREVLRDEHLAELAQYHIGNMYYYGQGVDPSDEIAFSLFEKSANQGYAPAINSVASMYYNGRRVEEDQQEAFRLYHKAAQQGYALALFNLGCMHYYGHGTQQNLLQAYRCWYEAAQQGFADALLHLGFMYCHGRGVPKDYKKAFKYVKQAAAQGHASAQQDLAFFYMQGLGTSVDCTLAAWYYGAAYKRLSGERKAQCEFQMKELESQLNLSHPEGRKALYYLYEGRGTMQIVV
tara:strand:- start:23543 stop:24490 length:948 start_codon:yes stop_codon:yes gene_type:complete